MTNENKIPLSDNPKVLILDCCSKDIPFSQLDELINLVIETEHNPNAITPEFFYYCAADCPGLLINGVTSIADDLNAPLYRIADGNFSSADQMSALKQIEAHPNTIRTFLFNDDKMFSSAEPEAALKGLMEALDELKAALQEVEDSAPADKEEVFSLKPAKIGERLDHYIEKIKSTKNLPRVIALIGLTGFLVGVGITRARRR